MPIGSRRPRPVCAPPPLSQLQGDPSLAFIREVLKSTRNEPLPEEHASLWLQEQIDSGALPRDPELLRTLLAQARRDPAMVERLVTQAKDAKGKDIYTRRVNDPTERILGLDGLDTSQFNM